jgi:hypothetical protein
LTFDAPTADVACTRRGRSNTPLQALTLANDPMILELAGALGELMRNAEAAGEDALGLGYERCLARSPRGAERELLDAYRSQLLGQTLEAGTELAGAELHAWTAVARVLLNLDEFLTRE